MPTESLLLFPITFLTLTIACLLLAHMLNGRRREFRAEDFYQPFCRDIGLNDSPVTSANAAAIN